MFVFESFFKQWLYLLAGTVFDWTFPWNKKIKPYIIYFKINKILIYFLYTEKRVLKPFNKNFLWEKFKPLSPV